MSHEPQNLNSLSRPGLARLSPLLVGLAIFVLGRGFDGFVGGLFDGAGVTLIVIGVVLVGQSMAGAPNGGGSRGWWLPSRDGEAPQVPASSDEQ